jgi:hypothetical protein
MHVEQPSDNYRRIEIRRQTMNVGSFNQSLFNSAQRPNSANRQSKALSFDDEGKKMKHSELQQDDLLNQFWSMTDEMPRKNQISLAASAVASKVFKNGISSDSKAFLKNIGDRFSPEEIGELKTELKSHPMMKEKSIKDIEGFFQQLDKVMSSQSANTEDAQKQQKSPNLRTPEEIFFQTTLKYNPLMANAIAA